MAYEQAQEMRADEIEAALSGMDTAKGSDFGVRLPFNSDVILDVSSITVKRNEKKDSKLNGTVFCAIDGSASASSTPDRLPVGAQTGLYFAGLDSNMNRGSLKALSQEGLRRALAAMLRMDPDGSAPHIPGATTQGWPAVAGFFAKNPDRCKGMRIRVVTGPQKPGKDYPATQQYFPVG